MTVVNEELSKAYTEVYSILKFVDEYYVSKISDKFLEYIYKQMDNTYIPNIDMSIPLEKQELMEDTVNILALIKYNYWCEDEKEKKEIINILNENEQKYQNELREKYNPEDIFKNKKMLIIDDNKENILKKLFNKIKNFFKTKK